MPGLFDTYELKGMKLRNRVVMPPMCQYVATGDGAPTDWHYVHYGARAIGGVGLIIVEATAVEPRGRLSGNDLGIWTDGQIEGLKRLIQVRRRSPFQKGSPSRSSSRPARSRAW